MAEWNERKRERERERERERVGEGGGERQAEWKTRVLVPKLARKSTRQYQRKRCTRRSFDPFKRTDKIV
jgi:hypothetical protein